MAVVLADIFKSIWSCIYFNSYAPNITIILAHPSHYVPYYFTTLTWERTKKAQDYGMVAGESRRQVQAELNGTEVAPNQGSGSQSCV